MRKLLAAALLVPTLAFGSTTWTTDTTLETFVARVVKAACTTGTESAPTLVSQGIDLLGLAGCAVHAEAAAAMTGGGKLLAYVWEPVVGRWNAAPDLDLVVSAIQYQAFAGITVPADVGRLAYVPSGVGQAVDIYLICTPLRRP